MVRSTVLAPGRVFVTRRGGLVVRVELGRNSGEGCPFSSKPAAMVDSAPSHQGLKAALEYLPEFSRRVLRACNRIPAGEVRSYQELAVKVGKPGGARAVGRVMARNPVPLLIPCHRVVKARGYLGGFGGGPRWKEFLLGREGWSFEGKGKSRRLKHKEKTGG